MTSSIGFTATLITPANFFVAALYDTSDLSTLLESIQVPKSGGSYPPDFEVTFTTNLQQDRLYRVILWESPDTGAHGVSRGSHDFKASLSSIKLRGSLYLTADVSAGLASGTSGYVDPTSSLVGWIYDLEQVGYGTLQPGTGNDYTLDGTTNDWTLINGALITNLMKFVLHFQAQVSAAPQPPVSAIQSGRVITGSTTLTNSDKNKALWVRATGSNISLTLMALASVANYDQVVIYSAGGNHINLVINTAGTDKMMLNTQVTQVILGQAEKLVLVKANGQWEVDYISPSYYLVGEYIYKSTKGGINTLFADGCISGPLLLRADYPRIYGNMDRLDAASITTEALWAAPSVVEGVTYFPNMDKWTRGNGTTTFRVPRLFNTGFLRGVDGTSRFANTFEIDNMLDHQHQGTTGTLSSSGPNLFGTGDILNKGNYNGRGSGATDLTSKAGLVLSGTFTQSSRVGPQVRPANAGVYISIRI